MPISSLVPIALQNLTEVVADRLRASILNGELKQGEKILELEIASKMGISRSPVREALRQLERDGLAIRVPNRGTVVRTLVAGDLVHLYAIRGVLEKLAVRLAIDRISDYQVAELKHLCGEMRSMFPLESDEDRAAFRARVVAFHSKLVEAAASPLLEETLAGIQLKIQFAMATVNRHARVSDVVPEHEALISAMEKRDLQAAELAVDRIMEGAVSRGLSLLSSQDNAREQPDAAGSEISTTDGSPG